MACEKDASDLGFGGGFRWVLQFPPPVTNGYSQLNCNMAEKVTNSKLLSVDAFDMLASEFLGLG